MGSRLIILDPELCLTTPEYHWLSTGFRSFDHCIEALCCLEATPESDAKAEKGLRLIAPNLLRCKADPNDVEARRQCQFAVRFAMDNIRAGITMGGSHAIGHQLGKSCLTCKSFRPLMMPVRPTGGSAWCYKLYHVSCGHEIQHPARRRQAGHRQAARQDQGDSLVRTGRRELFPEGRPATEHGRPWRPSRRLRPRAGTAA